MGEIAWQKVHAEQSLLREKIVEYTFIAEALRWFWKRGEFNAEILKSEFDTQGYDLYLDAQSAQRHIQFKATRSSGGTSQVNVSKRLASKASGCVIWMLVDDELRIEELLWFGGGVGEALPLVGTERSAKQTRANAQGEKKLKQNHVVLPRGRFRKFNNIDGLMRVVVGL